MACAPSFTAGRYLNPPPNFPIGVRAPARMTDEVMIKAPVVIVSEPFYERPNEPAYFYAFRQSDAGDPSAGSVRSMS